MTVGAMPVQYGLDFLCETESAGRSVKRIEWLRAPVCRLTRSHGHRRATLMLVAAHTGRVLTRLQRGPIAHGLNHVPRIVDHLKVQMS